MTYNEFGGHDGTLNLAQSQSDPVCLGKIDDQIDRREQTDHMKL